MWLISSLATSWISFHLLKSCLILFFYYVDDPNELGLKSKLNFLGEEQEKLFLRVQEIEERSLSQQKRLSQVYNGALNTRTKVFMISDKCSPNYYIVIPLKLLYFVIPAVFEK